MGKLYDPTDYEAMGPQVTARAGTKRHARQCAARRAFFNVMAVNEQAKADRAQRQLGEIELEYLILTPSAGSA